MKIVIIAMSVYSFCLYTRDVVRGLWSKKRSLKILLDCVLIIAG
jgi:hypothetical protein